MAKMLTEKPKKDNTTEILTVLSPAIEKLVSAINENQKAKAPIAKRAQWMNFGIMVLLCLATTIMAIMKVIDGSAATGLIGAIIGYVFGHTYSSKEKK